MERQNGSKTSVGEWVHRLLSPLMNQRGFVGEQDAVEDQGIAGTSFKTPEELAAAYTQAETQRVNLEKKLGEQGNELGTLRKEKEILSGQAETLAGVLKENLTKGKSQPKDEGKEIDYDAEIAAVEKQIQDLDPMAEGYSKNLASLVKKSNKLTAAAQHEKTLSAAGNMFKKELNERDAKAAQDAFYNAHPTFNTPEMQARIKQFLAGDRTGMHDPMSAFFQIERDDIAAKAAEIAKENEEYKKLIELNKGKDDAGKVVIKGKSPGQQETKHAKVTGKDLDAGMAAALEKARSAA